MDPASRRTSTEFLKHFPNKGLDRQATRLAGFFVFLDPLSALRLPSKTNIGEKRINPISNETWLFRLVRESYTAGL